MSRLVWHIAPAYRHLEKEILQIPLCFQETGEVISSARNVLKRMEIGGIPMNVKSFQLPHWINRIAYAWLRKSKARRSFEYASLLLSKQIGTPEPVAYIEERKGLGLGSSYYICLQLENVRTFKQLTLEKPADWREMLCAFTRFTYDFQQKGIYFIDHSPGNTLIRRTGEGEFRFYLVDLNRMKFRTLDRETGLKNFYRLGMDEEMCAVVATEYARLTGGEVDRMVRQLTSWTLTHNDAVRKKKAKKKKK